MLSICSSIHSAFQFGAAVIKGKNPGFRCNFFTDIPDKAICDKPCKSFDHRCEPLPGAGLYSSAFEVFPSEVNREIANFLPLGAFATYEDELNIDLTGSAQIRAEAREVSEWDFLKQTVKSVCVPLAIASPIVITAVIVQQVTGSVFGEEKLTESAAFCLSLGAALSLKTLTRSSVGIGALAGLIATPVAMLDAYNSDDLILMETQLKGFAIFIPILLGLGIYYPLEGISQKFGVEDRNLVLGIAWGAILSLLYNFIGSKEFRNNL